MTVRPPRPSSPPSLPSAPVRSVRLPWSTPCALPRLLVPARCGTRRDGRRAIRADRRQDAGTLDRDRGGPRRANGAARSSRPSRRCRRGMPSARPIPAPGFRVAQAAVGEGTDLIVVDPGLRDRVRHPSPRRLGARAGRAVGCRASESAEVRQALQESIASELAALDIALEPGDPDARLRGPERSCAWPAAGTRSCKSSTRAARASLSAGQPMTASPSLVDSLTVAWSARRPERGPSARPGADTPGRRDRCAACRVSVVRTARQPRDVGVR